MTTCGTLSVVADKKILMQSMRWEHMALDAGVAVF